MDSGATTYYTVEIGKISTPCISFISNLFVENGNQVLVLGSGHTILPHPTNPFHLKNILQTLNVVKNLVTVCKFFLCNSVSIEFDPFGVFIKDIKIGKLMTRHNSFVDLYPFTNQVHAPTLSFNVYSTSHI